MGGDRRAILFQGEMPGVQKVEVEVHEVPLVGIRPVGREDVVVLAPDDQRRRLVLTE